MEINEGNKIKQKEIENFLKEAFCIDGECVYIEDVVVNSIIKKIDSTLFALTDSKRGRFYVTIGK